MATLTTNLSTEESMHFTSDLEYIKITLDETETSCPFNLFIGGSINPALSTTYYAPSGKKDIYIYDIRSIIEDEMLRLKLPLVSVTISLKRVALGYNFQSHFIYSRKKISGISAEEFVNETFFSTNKNILVKPTGIIPLTIYAPKSAVLSDTIRFNYTISILAEDANGNQRAVIKMVSDSYKTEIYGNLFITRYIDVASLQEYAIQNLRKFVTVKAIYVVYGARKLGMFVCNNPSREFYYRNNFGAWDFASLHTITTEKTETKYSTAICNGKKSHYDRQHTQSFEEQTSTLLMDQARALTEMLTSPEVRLVDGNKSPEDCPLVLINDYTSEISNEPGGSNSIKFEWEFADYDGMINMHSGSRIFSEQFNSVFA